MRPPRVAILVLFCSASLFLLCRSISLIRRSGPTATASTAQGSSFRTLFSFTAPFSLFPPSAAISLTDDNSTFFPARPAAFGSSLPNNGLSGQLWIGSGFSGESLQDGEGEGELGCGDIPGWEDDRATRQEVASSKPGSIYADATSSKRHYLANEPLVDRVTGKRRRPRGGTKPANDGTDDYLHQSLRQTRSPYPNGQTASGSSHADIQSIQETAEITGKIALLSRGGCGFLEKTKWAQRRGAIALVVGDNQKGGPLIQMFARGDVGNVTIPSVFTSRTTAHLLSSLMQPGSFIEDILGNNADPSLKVQQSPKHGRSKMAKAASSARRVSKTWPATAFEQKKFERTPRSWFSQLFHRRDGQSGKSDSASGPHSGLVPKSSSGHDKTDNEADAGSNETLESSDRILTPVYPIPADDEGRGGLRVTITPTGSSSPFFDTLLVLVISPLITLTVVYALLILRVKIRMRRWRAPKSVVDQLPVRTYHTVASSPTDSPRVPSPASSSPTTPLLQGSSRSRPRSRAGTGGSEPGDGDLLSVEDALGPPRSPSIEKDSRRAPSQWKKYMGRQVECVVCLEEYEDGVSRVMSLPCGHEFHAECM